VHLTTIAAAGLLLTAAVGPVLVTARAAAPRVEEPRRARTGSRALLVVLGMIAGCTAYGEGAVTDWGALHLRETLHAPPGVAAAGYGAFALAMACGRLTGGSLLRLVGATRVLVYGSVLAAAGMLAAALAPDVTVALAGFALVGLGLANVFPVAIARAGATGGPSGVALASTVGYTGLLGGPPVIGLLVGAFGLPTALATVSALAAVAAALSLSVAPERAALAQRVSAAVDAGRVRAVAGLTPAADRYGPAVRRYAGDLALLDTATGAAPDRSLSPLTAVYLR
jgi:MFS family permease